MCRDVDFGALKGIKYDFACGEDPYCLNREPRGKFAKILDFFC